MIIHRSVLRGGLAVVGCGVLSGCVFMPSADQVSEQPPAASNGPDPAALRLPALDTRHFDLDGENHELLGDPQVLFAKYENTLPGIAREYDVGFEELRHANPGVDVWLPGEGTPVYLPTALVIPDAPRAGIIINVASMRLLYFTTFQESTAAGVRSRVAATSYPVGIGREGWATPLGEATVTQKARDPTWYPPASVRAEHAANGDPLPAVVPPGPDNPLGAFALALSLPGYLIHGTNTPAGVGMRASAGCIRLYPEDIEALFDRVPSGTPVRIVNQPVLAGWRDDELYLEVHRPLAEDQSDLAALAETAIAAALERRNGGTTVAIDTAAVARIVAEQRGMPFPVLAREQSFERYLAQVRIVENTAPITGGETTAKIE
jgi:L,D-transpeptidase ErfK/SrfK